MLRRQRSPGLRAWPMVPALPSLCARSEESNEPSSCWRGLEDPALRRRVTAGLNKGEARNSLARAVFFNRLGELRDRSFENQRHRASGLNLVVAAITLWNTVYIERATEQMAKYGSSIPPCSSMSPRLAGNTSISPAITPGTPINGLPRVALDPSEAPETPPSLLSVHKFPFLEVPPSIM